MPEVSVVTVTFEAAQDVGPTMQSIASQRGVSFETILVDGGSSDATVATARRLGPTGMRVVSEADSGIYDAMNKGLKLARGTYVLFMNAGDSFADSNSLAKLAKAAPGTLGSVGDAVWFSSRRVLVHPAEHRNRLERWVRGWNHQAALVDRAKMLAVGGFDPRFDVFADYHLLLLLTNRYGPLTRVAEPVVRFRMGDTPYEAHIRQKIAALNDVEGRFAAFSLMMASGIIRVLRKARLWRYE